MSSTLARGRAIATRASFVGLFVSLGISVSGTYGWGYPDLPWFLLAHVVMTAVAIALALAAIPRSALALLVAGVVLLYSAVCIFYLERATTSWCHPPSTDPTRERRIAHVDYVSAEAHCVGPESGDVTISIAELLNRGIVHP